MGMTPSEILRAADSIFLEFQDILQQCSDYELKGIFHSEMLALCALIKALNAGHVIESGRARGQSTEIIARFVERRNIAFHSIEFDPTSVDVPLAARRLAPVIDQVSLVFGDAHKVLPGLLAERPTVVLIDGPKGAGALQLATAALRSESVRAVCMHDVHKDAQPHRGWLEDTFPHTWFSDDPAFVDRFSFIDEDCWRTQRTGSETKHWYPYRRGEKAMLSYSATLGVIFNQDLDARAIAAANNAVQDISRLERQNHDAASRLASHLPYSIKASGLYRRLKSIYRRLENLRP